jgi:prepilin-type N-terminal cleavage/methylation domain-containing protein
MKLREFGTILKTKLPHNKNNRLEYRRNGFTIVELLIVVVVIAILAAITIVSYNGISARSKASAAQSSVRQAATKIEENALRNSDTYPQSLSDAGLSSTDSNNYQYWVNNATNPKKFCISASRDTVAYFLSNTQRSPQLGTCYEQSLITSTIEQWESGDYSSTSGNPISSGTRLRFMDIIAVNPGAVYTFTTGSSAHDFAVRGFDENQSFVSNIGAIPSGTAYTVPSNVHYIRLSLYGSGSNTYATYVSNFGNGSIVPRVMRNV